MKYFSIFLAFLAICLFTMPDLADAKRFGGSRSFGSKPSFSTQAPKAPSTGATSGSTFNQRNTTNNSNAATAGTAGAGAATASRGGFGLMGGLLAGTLLGSMFFGTPFAGGGFMDIIIIGLLFYFGMRIMRSFTGNKRQQQPQRPQSQQHYQSQNNTSNNNAVGNSVWDNLKANNQDNQNNYADYSAENQATNYEQNQANTLQENEEFLEGAKTLYVRMQDSWDKRDLADIQLFTTSAVYSEIKKQAIEDPNPSETLIISVNAQINTKETDGEMERISVYFNAMLREDKEQAMAENVTELWHFMRENKESNWKLDGIQQIK